MSNQEFATRIYRGTTDAEMIRAFAAEAAQASTRRWEPVAQDWSAEDGRRILVAEFRRRPGTAEGRAPESAAEAAGRSPAGTSMRTATGAVAAARAEQAPAAPAEAPPSAVRYHTTEPSPATVTESWGRTGAASADEVRGSMVIPAIIGIAFLVLFVLPTMVGLAAGPEQIFYNTEGGPFDEPWITAPVDADVAGFTINEPADGDVVTSPVVVIRGIARGAGYIWCKPDGGTRHAVIASPGADWQVAVVVGPGEAIITCGLDSREQEVTIAVIYDPSASEPALTDPGEIMPDEVEPLVPGWVDPGGYWPGASDPLMPPD